MVGPHAPRSGRRSERIALAEVVPVTIWAAVKGRNAWLLDLIRSRLWPVPVIGVVTAAATGFLLPYFEGRLPTPATEELFGGGAAAARGVLSTIAASMITVTSLTFSLTLVTFYGCGGRFLAPTVADFRPDGFVQRTLALFVPTFCTLTVLPGGAPVATARLISAAGLGEPSPTCRWSVPSRSFVFRGAPGSEQIRVETILGTDSGRIPISVARRVSAELDERWRSTG